MIKSRPSESTAVNAKTAACGMMSRSGAIMSSLKFLALDLQLQNFVTFRQDSESCHEGVVTSSCTFLFMVMLDH